MANNQITLTSLDFDSLKASLIQFLQGQSQFSGYNFEGAGLNILLDILAYNSHLNSFYLNMVANEMFLDTAVLRASVVSHAKALGYTPRSATSAVATINCAITRSATDNTAILTLPRFTAFNSDNLNGSSFQFLTLDAITQPVSGNTFLFQDVQIFEGTPVTKVFNVSNTANPTQTFDLTDPNIDMATLLVILQKSPTNIQQTVFIPANDVTEVLSTDAVYFTQEGANGNYQIYFGDGVVGQSLPDGGLLIVSYLITDGANANFISGFTLQANPLAGGNSNVVTVVNSAGGGPNETIASIQFNAPKSFVAQNRAVTINDYITLINKNYPYFDAVNVWGGETLTPPQYGKIFVSVKPKQGFAVTAAQQQFLLNNIIAPISVVTVIPVYVPVDFNYINLIMQEEYDSKQTTRNPGQLAQLVTAAVNNYTNNSLNTFNSEFRFSRLLAACDAAEPSILSSAATIWIEKQFTPTLNVSGTYILTIGFPLVRGSVNNLLYSSPAVTLLDSGGIPRSCFIEETPESFATVEGITVDNPGLGYLEAPAITIHGDGVGANAFAIIVNGKVASVVVDNPGNNYTQATATVTDAGGSGALLSVSLLAQTGVLRTFYFDDNNNKIIINPKQGTIDYLNGVITITNLLPISVTDPFGILRIFAEPASTNFKSTNQRILTIDPNNPTAVQVFMNDINNQ